MALSIVRESESGVDLQRINDVDEVPIDVMARVGNEGLRLLRHVDPYGAPFSIGCSAMTFCETWRSFQKWRRLISCAFYRRRASWLGAASRKFTNT